MGAAAAQQVFLSHCVATMGEPATEMNSKLESSGYTTFICTDMIAGAEFRRSITINAANCKIMIVFLDESWANSRECISEFNCAYSCFNKKGSPQFIPIVIGGFHWIDPERYPEAHCITSNFHCLKKCSLIP